MNKILSAAVATALIATIATSAQAATKPLAVWNGDFPTSSSGTDTRGSYILSVNGNTAATDGASITISDSSTGGIKVVNTNGTSSAVGVQPFAAVVGCSGVAAATSTYPRVLVASQAGGSGCRANIGFNSGSAEILGYVSSVSTSATYRTSSAYTWPGTDLHYLGFCYNSVKGSSNYGTYAYMDGSSSAVFYASGLVYGGDLVSGAYIGGLATKADHNMADMQVSYIALLNSSDGADIAAWSLSSMTTAETISSEGGTITGGSAVGVNLNGGTVSVSADTTVAALFVQASTELSFADDATLTVNGPVYVAEGATLTLSTVSEVSGSRTLINYTTSGYDSDEIVSSSSSYSVADSGSALSLTAYSNTATVSGAVNWSEISWTDGAWHAGAPTTLTLAADAVITFDDTYAMSSLVLSGGYAATLVYTKAPSITSGVTCENSATYVISIPATDTDFDFSSAWTVPAGVTYILAGTETSGETNTCSGAITVNGTLKTTGNLVLSSTANTVAADATLEIAGGSTTASFDSQGIKGHLIVDSGATFVSGRDSDILMYSGSPVVDVYGTLDFSDTRWTARTANTFNFYAGSTITGAGNATYGALDSDTAITVNILAYGDETTVNFTATPRLRSSQTFNIASGLTVNYAVASADNVSGGVVVSGSGKLVIAEGSTIETAFTVNSGATLELAGGALPTSISGSGSVVVSADSSLSLSSFTGTASVSESVDLTLTGVDSSTAITVADGGAAIFDESLATDGVITLGSVTTNGTGAVKVLRVTDETETEVTVAASGDSTTITSAPTVSGTATILAYEFNDTNETLMANGFASSGTNDTNLVFYNAGTATITYETNSVGEAYAINPYQYDGKTPYNSYVYPSGSWTCSIAGRLPDSDKVALITFGTRYAGLIGLISGDASENEVLLVLTTGDSAYTTLATMTVPNATSAVHNYVFIRKTNEIVVYLDGTYWSTYVSDEAITFGNCMQIGSVYNGVGSTGIKSVGSGSTALIDSMRIFEGELGTNAIAALAAEFPYTNPNGDYTRTVTGSDNLLSESNTWYQGETELEDALPATGADIIITASDAATLDVNASYTASCIEFSGDGSLMITNSSGTLTANGVVTVNTDVTNKYGAVDFSGVPVVVASGKSLVFDFSDYDVTSVSGSGVLALTGTSESNQTIAVVGNANVVCSYNSATKSYEASVYIAYIGDVGYTTIAAAITAAGDDNLFSISLVNDSLTIPDGYALVTKSDSTLTLRTVGDIYWAASNAGDWSGTSSSSTHTFYLTNGYTTAYVSGDRVVVTNDVHMWSKTAAHGADYRIGTEDASATVWFSRSGDACNNYIIENSEVEVESGSVLVFERYSLDSNNWDSYNSSAKGHFGSKVLSSTISGSGTVNIGTNAVVYLTDSTITASNIVFSSSCAVTNYNTTTFVGGQTLTFGSATPSFNAGTVAFDSGTVTIAFESGVTPVSNATLIAWSAAPTGSGTFKLADSFAFKVESTDTGLVILSKPKPLFIFVR